VVLFDREKLKLVVSDFHLGRGPYLPDGRRNYLEDFFSDRQFCEFLEHYHKGRYKGAEVELIINGDFFDHLQVDPDEFDPTYVNERVALARTNAIIDGHPEVFEALKEFCNVPRHSITFIIGNHDIGLFFPLVRKRVEELIGERCKVLVEPIYCTDGLCVEHGNGWTVENWIDYKKPLVEGRDGEMIVDLPWGSLFQVHYLNKVKRERPYISRVYPFKHYLIWGLMHDTWFSLKAFFTMLGYFFKAMLRIGENRQFTSRHTLRVIRQFSFPMNLRRAAKLILDANPNCQCVVLGHGHKALQRQFVDGREYINTGLWNEMISLDIGTMGRYLRFTFAEIEYDKSGLPHSKLREWHGHYREVEDSVSI